MVVVDVEKNIRITALIREAMILECSTFQFASTDPNLVLWPLLARRDRTHVWRRLLSDILDKRTASKSTKTHIGKIQCSIAFFWASR